MPYWSAVQTESRRENVAADFLERDFNLYLPKIQTDDRVTPLFPGYLFVEIVDQWWSIRWTVGVARVLMMNEQPAKVPLEMINAIRETEIDGIVQLPTEPPKPKPRALKCGDTVRVTQGSFMGRIGIYQGQSGPRRSLILLNLLGREVKTVVSACDLVRFES